jgi:hypothetical protein
VKISDNSVTETEDWHDWLPTSSAEKNRFRFLTDDEIFSLQAGDRVWIRAERFDPIIEVIFQYWEDEALIKNSSVIDVARCQNPENSSVHNAYCRRLCYQKFEREDIVLDEGTYEL